MSHPEWLNQVPVVPVPPGAPASGQSETAVALGAIADHMRGDGPAGFAVGEVVGVVIARGAGVQYCVAVSTGDVEGDIERLAQTHGADVASISLVPAAAMLLEQFQGTSACLQVPKAPAAGGVDYRVTVDALQYLLQKKKAEGIPGDTIVALSGLDNNGRRGAANFEVAPHVATVAKAEFDKNWSIAKFVSRGGVPVLVLG